MQILLADMDQTLLEVIQMFLVLKGQNVQTASNGLTCVRLLGEMQPELLILDDAIMWGRCDGVIDWVSTLPGKSLHSVIIMGDTGSSANLCESGISVRHLVKPFGLAELLQQVDLCRMDRCRSDKLPHLIENSRRDCRHDLQEPIQC